MRGLEHATHKNLHFEMLLGGKFEVWLTINITCNSELDSCMQ